MEWTYRSLRAGDDAAVDGLQRAYAAVYPQRKPAPAQVYLSPYFREGQNVWGAFTPDGSLVAFAPYFPQGNLAWVEVEALPGLAQMAEVKAALWQWLVQRGREDRLEQLCFQYFAEEHEGLAFARQCGAQYNFSIFSMQRDLSQPVPAQEVPAGFSLRRWRMQSEAEQRQYLEARNACFPEAPTRLEEWRFFADSPLWEQGANLAAFAGEKLAASVLTFWEPGSLIGSTEYVFTCSEYRGRGLARCLLAEGLVYLREHGLQSASLEVKAENRAALGVYLDLGYEVTAESQVYGVGLGCDPAHS